MSSNVTHIEVYKDLGEDWRWHAKAANGEIVAIGESHTRQADAERAASDVFPGIPVEVKTERGEDNGSA